MVHGFNVGRFIAVHTDSPVVGGIVLWLLSILLVLILAKVSASFPDRYSNLRALGIIILALALAVLGLYVMDPALWHW